MQKKKNSRQSRSIDRAAKESQKWLSKKMTVVKKDKLRGLKVLMIVAFIAGGLSMLVWAVKMNIQSSSDATNGDNISQAEELKKIKDEIKQKGAKWEAGDTEVSKLSKEDRKKKLGAKPLSEAPATASSETYSANGGSASTLPVTFDWRNNGGNFVTPVRDQGSCGSCWAFAGVAALESAELVKNKTPYVTGTDDLAEQVVLSCSGAGNCDGGWLNQTSTFLSQLGTPDEICYGYSGTNSACSNACANWTASAKKFNNFITVSRDLASIKNAIYKYGPVAVRMSVYSDFYYYTGGIYKYVSGYYVGDHYVVLVGYDDNTQSFIVKNSWGTRFGQAGFFQIAYSELTSVVNLGSEAFAYNTSSDTIAPQAAITSPVDGSTVSGSVPVSVTASDNVGVSKVLFYVDNVLKYTDTASPWSYAWNSFALANGAHSLYAVAVDAVGHGGTSAVVTVTSSNVPDTTAPTVSISLPVNNSIVSKTLKIAATATDNVGVSNMAAYVDGRQYCSSATSPLNCSLTTRNTTRGVHTIEVKSYDLSNNVGSASVTATLK